MGVVGLLFMLAGGAVIYLGAYKGETPQTMVQAVRRVRSGGSSS